MTLEMTLPLNSSLTTESIFNEKGKEPSFLLQESTRQSEKPYKMIFSFFKTKSLEFNL